jgi:hypothetical protein
VSQFFRSCRPMSWCVTTVACTLSGLAGGIVGRLWAMAMPMQYDGVPVTLSSFGQVFFFLLGVIAGIIAALSIAARMSWQGLNWRRAFVLVLAGCIAAPVMVFMLCGMFLTIPYEVFELLTGPPAHLPRN